MAHLIIAHVVLLRWRVYLRDQSQSLVGVCVNIAPITDLRAYVTAQTWMDRVEKFIVNQGINSHQDSKICFNK